MAGYLQFTKHKPRLGAFAVSRSSADKSRKSRQTRLDVNKLVFPYDVGQEYSDALYYHTNLVKKDEGIFPLLVLSWIAPNILQMYVLTLKQFLEYSLIDLAAIQWLKKSDG
jgi:hypothetical protein